MHGYKIVETDNFGRDYPNEKFVSIPQVPEEAAKAICEVINTYCSGPGSSRYWKVVEDGYILQPGFEP